MPSSLPVDPHLYLAFLGVMAVMAVAPGFWPLIAEAAIPGFRSHMLAYIATMEALCRKLVRLYALALDLPPTAPIAAV